MIYLLTLNKGNATQYNRFVCLIYYPSKFYNKSLNGCIKHQYNVFINR